MDGKQVIVEKRVKSTVIRRRTTTQKEEAPKPIETSSAPVVEEGVLETKSLVAEAPKKKGPIVIGMSESVAAGDKKDAPKRSPVIISRPDTPVLSEKEALKARRPPKRKSRDELEMELIQRAGGLKKVAQLVDTPERLDRVFQPKRGGKKKKQHLIVGKDFKKTELTTPKAVKRVIRMEGTITVGELAKRMSVKLGDVVKKLMQLGVMATANQVIDYDTSVLIANDYAFEIENVAFEESAVLVKKSEAAAEDQMTRSPVVTVMGHVDHGKTSLLDAIRKTQVVSGEAGGITQHIGAYQVQTSRGLITFIDTPGHAAFTSMRARGANLTDIVILVVAADDGVMPQTEEAINHAKAAKVPLIVAVNKIDKPEANPKKVRQELMAHSLVPEELGGDTIYVDVSAKAGTGLDKLLEMILLQAEVLELHANPKANAKGVVVEARLDKGRGPVSTILVQNGTLKLGQPIVAGLFSGRVRALVNSFGQEISEAGPSVPVEVLGIAGVPNAGDSFNSVDSEEDAKNIADHRTRQERQEKMVKTRKASLEDIFTEAQQQTGQAELKVIIKADVQGSAEALKDSLVKLSTEKVKLTVIHTAVGAVNESDVSLAHASDAIIIGFGVRPDTKARSLAETEGIEIKTYTIIYEVLQDVKNAMIGLLAPTYKEIYLGRAEVRQTFTVSKIGLIAGCMVVDGKISRAGKVRLLRDGTIIHTGKIDSLKRFKDDAREVAQGLECGIGIEKFNDVKEGDLIEAFMLEELTPEL